MYTHITRDKRISLATLLREGYNKKDVAHSLGVHPSTIGRELKRNLNSGSYHATHANMLAKERRKESKVKYRKIENDKVLSKKIEGMLHPLVSPETVAYEFGIVHATIYDWIYRSRPDLKKVLPYRGKKRRRYGVKRTVKQGWAGKAPCIEVRVKKEKNWEGDTVKGGTRAQLLTHVEDVSLFTVVDKIQSAEADVVQAKMKEKEIFKESTITYDRGSEFALYGMTEKDLNVNIYFAHAHHPWERGKNENTNGRLRRVYPKKFNFDTITQEDLNKTVWLMNHTKRKSLKWCTPCSVFGKCCTSK